MFQIHVNEAIVSRCLSDKRRKAVPSFQALSDVMQEKVKGTKKATEPVVRNAEERANDEEGTAAGMRGIMNVIRNKTSALPDINRHAVTVSEDDWLMVYRFNHIVAIRTFCRLKIYQAAGTGIVGLFSLASHLMGFKADALFYALIMSGLATVSLYIVGNFLRHVVGFAYLSPDQKYAKISHIDFWGRRQNHIISLSHIVPIRESKPTLFLRQLFISEPNSPSKCYVFMVKEATFVKPETFADVFGIDVAEISSSETNASGKESK